MVVSAGREVQFAEKALVAAGQQLVENVEIAFPGRLHDHS